jgi:hypothetical protein
LVGRRKQVKLQWLQAPMNEYNLKEHAGKLVDISGTRKGNIWKTELRTLKQTVRIRISETCIGA